MEPNIQEAVAVLKKFIIAMNRWEVYFFNLTEEYDENSKNSDSLTPQNPRRA